VTTTSTHRHVGKPYLGLTNRELAAGKGLFVSDIVLPGMAHLAILRSPHAAARIVSIDTSAAEGLDGVVYVMTGAEAKTGMSPIPEAWNTKEIGAKGVDWYALAPDRVRYVGEAVAAVVAESKNTAFEAVGLIDVTYEVLPAVTDPRAALETDSTLVEPDWGDNLLITRDWRTGDMEGAFERAERIIEGEVRSERITGVSLEPRGSVAQYDAYQDKLTLWESTQNPHPLRTFLAETLGIPERTIHVIQPNVGGAFGLKQPPFQEQPLIAYLAKKLGRPIKWIEGRDENFATTGHSRDVRFDYRAAFDRDGIVSGLDIRVIADVGAPTALLGWGQSFVTAYCLPTVYRVPNNRMRLSVVVTNNTP
jgi:carbon-monoxide dehydrogenase large subunit